MGVSGHSKGVLDVEPNKRWKCGEVVGEMYCTE